MTEYICKNVRVTEYDVTPLGLHARTFLNLGVSDEDNVMAVGYNN